MNFPRDVENDGQHVDFEQFWEKPGKCQEMDCANQNCPQFSMGKRMGIGVGETQLISGVDLQMGKWTDVKTETAEHFL